MNLVTEQWIPVLNTHGAAQYVNLRDVLCHGAHYRDLAVRPHERVALMRLLLCIAHAALDGPQREDWRRVPDLLPDKAQEYLNTWQDSFDLFHPTRPFLQIAGLQVPAKNDKSKGKKAAENTDDTADEGPTAKVSKLDFSLATGNNCAFFDHEGTMPQRTMPLKKLALNLLTFQCFALGGGKSSPVLPRQENPKNFSDSLCCVGSMLHTFWRGGNLLETLHRNLCHKEFIEEHYHDAGFPDAWGRPVWEQMPDNLDDTTAIANATSTYLGRLLPLSRLILLWQDCASMLLGAGLVYKKYNNTKIEFVEEPTATIALRTKDNKQIRTLLCINPDKALWRELHALLAHRDKYKTGGFWAARHTWEGKAHDVLVVGMLRTPGKADVIDTLESVYYVPAAMCEESSSGRMLYAEGVELSDKIHMVLREAIAIYRMHDIDGKIIKKGVVSTKQDNYLSMLHQKAITYYWTAAEQNLPLLFACVETLGTDAHPPAWEAWRKVLWAAAHRAYRLACAPQSPRQFKAFAKGLGALSKAPDDTHSDTTSTANKEA